MAQWLRTGLKCQKAPVRVPHMSASDAALGSHIRAPVMLPSQKKKKKVCEMRGFFVGGSSVIGSLMLYLNGGCFAFPSQFLPVVPSS